MVNSNGKFSRFLSYLDGISGRKTNVIIRATICQDFNANGGFDQCDALDAKLVSKQNIAKVNFNIKLMDYKQVLALKRCPVKNS